MLVACLLDTHWLHVALIKYFSCLSLRKRPVTMAWSRMCTCTVSDRRHVCPAVRKRRPAAALPTEPLGRQRKLTYLLYVCACSRGMPSLLVTSLSACKASRRDWRGRCGRWIPNVSVAVTVGCKKKWYGVCFRNVIGSWYSSSIYAFTTFFCWMLSHSWTIESLITRSTWICCA